MVNRVSTGAMKVLCSREHVLIDFNLSSAPVEPTLRNQSTGAMKVLCSREHVLMDSNYSSAPVEPTVQNQSTGALDVLCSRTLVWVDQRTSSAPVEPMPLRSMHRCNDASVDTVSELQRLLLWHRETGWTDAHIFYTVGSSGGHGFSAENFQRLCDLLHSI